MKKRAILWFLWLPIVMSLYYFENNTGTRILLAAALLLPLFPDVRHELFRPDLPQSLFQPALKPKTVFSFDTALQEDSGEVRPYLPGDPVNHIHWKLSAKKNELLVREKDRSTEKIELQHSQFVQAKATSSQLGKTRLGLLFIALSMLSLAMLFALPPALRGAQALANRIFNASEQVNTYAYDHFPVQDTQPVFPAVLLLAVQPLCLLGYMVLSGHRWPAFAVIGSCALFQAYFGLAFPAWVNDILFAGFTLWLMRRPVSRLIALRVVIIILSIAVVVVLLYPGVDAVTEAASEQTRDWLSQMFVSVSGSASELPPGETETRHVHTRTLSEGAEEARPDREYRLVTMEEQQISRPEYLNILKTVFLLLATVALLVLPFAPFWWINRRQQKAWAARSVFESEDISTAVCAIFQQVISWLEASGHSAGNEPYVLWTPFLPLSLLPEGYEERFLRAAQLFEEAAYSTHPLPEHAKSQVLDLLNETEAALLAAANWKQRLKLKYLECLWI